MAEFFEIAQKLGAVSFTTLLVAILYGNYKGIWCWGYQLQKAEAAAERWQAMALQATGLAETSASIAKNTRVS